MPLPNIVSAPSHRGGTTTVRGVEESTRRLRLAENEARPQCVQETIRDIDTDDIAPSPFVPCSEPLGIFRPRASLD